MSSLTTAGSAEEHCPVSVEEFGTHLSLGIGGGGGGGRGSSRPPPPQQQQKQQEQQGRRRPRTVQLFGEVLSVQDDDGGRGQQHRDREPTAAPASRRKRDHGGSSVVAAVAAGGRSKKTRKITGSGGGDDGDRWSPTSDGGGGGGRKKLRLTGAQAAMLKDSFRAHSILSHAEKQELARRAGLSARQVEVWFQNRRARTKLKQTELDCELLRRWCDRLTDENARLRRDLAELRSSAGRLAVCSSCCDKKVAMAATRAGDMA